MYVCGPTVYDHIHVGNARAAIVFDVIRRYLEWRGYEVTFVQNYTDIDDKIIAKAADESRPWDEVALDYSREFEKVASAIWLRSPDVLVRATDHIPDMVRMIEKLIRRGFAYESGGSVWFAVDRFPGYGKLSGRQLEDLRAGERVEPDPHKRSPLDFAVWKAAKPGEPYWESPWGNGRPGWHIECSAMSARYLGMGFDIHGGGADLIFPHHENEIAQAEAAEDTAPFVRYWLHNGMVNLDAEKMSKSIGNLVLVKDLLPQLRPEVLRIMAIAGNYRHDVDFGEASIEQAGRIWERLETFAREAGDAEGDPSAEGQGYLDRFKAAMDDDFNTPVAIGVIQDLVRHGNHELEVAATGDGQARDRLRGLLPAFYQMTSVLGIIVGPIAEPTMGDELTEGLIGLAMELRDEARKARRYDEADSIRERLSKLGVVLEDTPNGTRWKVRTSR